MEIRAIIVATVTIYSGLYYLTNDLSNSSKIVLFIVMVVANLYFLIYWLIKITGAGIDVAREKISCLKSFIKGSHIEDGYDDSLTVNKDFS